MIHTPGERISVYSTRILSTRTKSLVPLAYLLIIPWLGLHVSSVGIMVITNGSAGNELQDRKSSLKGIRKQECWLVLLIEWPVTWQPRGLTAWLSHLDWLNLGNDRHWMSWSVEKKIIIKISQIVNFINKARKKNSFSLVKVRMEALSISAEAWK